MLHRHEFKPTRHVARITNGLLSGASVAAMVLGSTGAWAQCIENGNVAGFNIPVVGGVQPVAGLTPLGAGTALGALSASINTINTAFLTSTSAFVSAPGNAQPNQQGSGVWSRVVAGSVDTTSRSVGTVDASGVPTPVVATGSVNCQTNIRQTYTGYQFGHDIAVLNRGGHGVNVHVGATAGYFEASTKDRTPFATYLNPNASPGTLFVSPAGSFTSETQIPFVGIYSTITWGKLALDGLARFDYHRNALTDKSNGLSGQPLNARSFSLTGNASYTFDVGNSWFIEPSAGVVWSHTEVDQLNVSGLRTTDFGFPYARGTVAVNDVNSVLARASLTVGATIPAGTVIWQPYVTASYFIESDGEVKATATELDRDLFAGSGIDGLKLNTTVQGIGSYWQFAAGTAVVLGNSGWLGYGRFDYRSGDNIEGYAGSLGLRYQFSPPAAAKASIKDSGPAVVSDTVNWTGFYLGAFAGSTWGEQNWDPVTGRPETNPGFRGFLVGGQTGYNYQIGRFVLGIEADYGFSDAKGGKHCPNPGNGIDFTCNAEVDDVGMLTGRVGVTWERALFYAKAGLAWGESSASTSFNNAFGRSIKGSSETQTGWAVGGGMEFALSRNWSAKAEYMHYDLGASTYTIDSGLRVNADTSGDLVRIGVNYHLK